MASSGPPNPNPMELEVTIISGKHLKNVNWRNGDLRPYATVWVDPDRRTSTKPDGSGSTKPVWNESFLLPLPPSSSSSAFESLLLTLEIFHSNPSESPKPLVGTARVRLADLLIDSPDSERVHSLDLLRPSGRPQGKVRIKIGLREPPPPPPPPPSVPSHPPPPGYPDYAFPPQSGYYYSSAPPQPPPPQRDYRDYPPPASYSVPPPPSSPGPPPPYGYTSYSDPYPGYFPGYYSRPPPPQPHRPFQGYGAPTGPSAPVDSSPYEQRAGGGVGSVTGAMGGMSLDDRGRYEEEKRGERAEESVTGGAVRDNFSDYRGKY